MGKKKEKWIPISISLFFVFVLSSLLYFNPPALQYFLRRFQNLYYDVMLDFSYKPTEKTTPIVIVDIDDKSISIEGRWPWNRKKIALLIEKLFAQKAKVVAIDFIFPEPEPNLVEQITQEIKTVPPELEAVKTAFNYDEVFAKALALGNSVLGFAFTNDDTRVGKLPEPLLELFPNGNEGVIIPNMKGYLADIPTLEKASKAGAFINASPDFDGVIRYSPMLLRFQNQIFPSLSLAAVNLFLDKPELKILMGKYRDVDAIEGIMLGKRRIPTDAWGRILVPFRGPPFSVPYVSATDVLSGTVKKEQIENKLIFIGSSATAMGDLVATSIAPVFVGIEIHAHIASGILDGYLPYKPVWEKGAELLLILILGSVLAFSFPFLGPIISFLLTVFVIALLIFSDYKLWEKWNIVFPIFFPILFIIFLFIINEIAGYLFERRRRKDLKATFGQYVPPEYLDQMLKKSEEFLKGESKELTVLFSDIRKFTAISEGLSAADLKKLLNDFLTPMTEAIFEEKGTIDKYVGDMIMAFWGAPLDDFSHAEHAILAAFDMQKKLKELNRELKAMQRPEIHIGIGINTGSMNVGDMGSKYRRAYTVLGDAVNLGSRLENLTRIYNVDTIVGEKTYEKTKNVFVFRMLDKVKVKGKEQAIAIYEPVCRMGEETEEMKRTLEEHKKAFDAYMQRRFDEAEALFKRMGGKLYEVYLKRIEEFRKNPPPENWDGSYTFESK